jgi:hypothetical protein
LGLRVGLGAVRLLGGEPVPVRTGLDAICRCLHEGHVRAPSVQVMSAAACSISEIVARISIKFAISGRVYFLLVDCTKLKSNFLKMLQKRFIVRENYTYL